MTQNEGWAEYSKLVLKELETLNKSIESLNEQINDLKNEIAVLKEREDRVSGLLQWKDRVDEVASPTQLKEMKNDVDDLKKFATKATTIFAAVQVFMGMVFALLKYFT
jgi:predicted nuclease with TOPRIM domain